MQRACSWRKRKTRVSREPYRRMHLLSHCRAPAPECSRRPPARPATAPLPQPPQPLPPPLAPGAEQEPRASASARPGAPGGQEARHHSGTARPRAAPVRPRCSAAAGLGRHGRPRAPPGSLACCPVVGGSARQGDAPAELSQNSGSAMQGGEGMHRLGEWGP